MSGSAKYPTFADVLDAPAQPYERMSRPEREKLRRRKMGVTAELGEKDGRFYSEAAEGGRDGWFVGRPIQEIHADVSDLAYAEYRRISLTEATGALC